MAQSKSYDALEVLIAAANEYAAAAEMCDVAAIEAAKKTAPAAHKAAMLALGASIVHVKATSDHVLYAAAMYKEAARGKKDDRND